MNRPATPEGGQRGALPRMTPYELVFASDQFEARVFPRIQEEADLLGRDARLREEFSFLSTAGRAVQDVLPAGAPAEATEQYRAILFHAFNFWRFGKRVLLLDPGVARYLVEAAPGLERWDFATPHPSLYLQLPANLFWGSISPDTPPEPVDGFFVSVGPAEDGLGKAANRLEILAVLGIRRDRAGFSVIPFDTETGPGIAAVWAEAEGRAEGRDFENILPGGEINGLYSILTSSEVLKLVARALWYVDAFPGCVTAETPPERRDADQPGSPPLPRLPYLRVRLDEPDAA